MIGAVASATLVGAVGQPVTVEVHLSSGLPAYTVVGLPDAAARESRDRVRAAILSSGLTWPRTRITVNLAPSGTRKGGAGLDLPIAVGILVASEALARHMVEEVAFIGELGLDGTVRHVPGIVALVEAMQADRVVTPVGDAADAEFVRPGGVGPVPTLRTLVDALTGRASWPRPPVRSPRAGGDEPQGEELDLADVRGQRVGRRAVEVAAAGRHHLLLVGPPGAGKTMLAERVPGLLPPLDRAEALEVCRVRSCAGLPLPCPAELRRPPFRAPHHGASAVALVGGGTSTMRPGEISLATHGVLFLDELGEFPSSVLDSLRQPLEEGVVRVSRAHGAVTLPARFLLVAAMNPCPCGGAGPEGHCQCSAAARLRAVRRVSGPLLDRFDLVVALDRPDPHDLVRGGRGESSGQVAARVAAVRACAAARGVNSNADIRTEHLGACGRVTGAGTALLEEAVVAGQLTGRGMQRVLRVARTLADLEERDVIGDEQVAEALVLRSGRRVLRPEAGW